MSRLQRSWVVVESSLFVNLLEYGHVTWRLAGQLQGRDRDMLHIKRSRKTRSPHADRFAHVLTFESHVAGVTVQLSVSYSDFCPGFRSSQVGLTVDALRSCGKGRVREALGGHKAGPQVSNSMGGEMKTDRPTALDCMCSRRTATRINKWERNQRRQTKSGGQDHLIRRRRPLAHTRGKISAGWISNQIKA